METCLFCKIINKEIPSYTVFEDNHWLAFLDIKPINLGHTLLIPKEHHKNLFDLPKNLLQEAGPLLQKISTAIMNTSGATGLNIAMNNEAAAGQLVFHTHIHLIPRFDKDGLTHWPGKDNISKEEFSETAEIIKNQLS